ncbi:MAG TPA: nucleoside/nucleotide kinase family protein [Micromonosporaceae bacterium]
MPSTTPSLLPDARDAVAAVLDANPGRVLVGVTGPPAAGKSTLAEALASEFCRGLGPQAAVAVPMDGFHLASTELARLGLANRKGAPLTFDAAGFVHLLARIRAGGDGEIVYAPRYSRVLHESIGSAIPVFPHTRLVVVEGNYLLLRTGAWAGVRPLLHLVIYLDAPPTVRVGSLLRRQRSRGLDPEAAHDWVHRSDEANAALIATTRPYADLVLSREA